MLDALSRNWWLLVLRGAVAVLFGILAFVWPGMTLQILVVFFGAYVLVDGIGSVVTGIAHRQGSDRWWLLLEGLSSILFGVLTFLWPGVTEAILLIFVAVWAVLTGIFEILAAVRLRKQIMGEWVLGLAGLFSVLFGVYMFVNLSVGALAVVWLIGSYAILFGLLLVYLGFKLRGGVDNSVA